MLKRSGNVLDNDPIIFAEDVYLFTDKGELLTGRYSLKRKIRNAFSLISPEDVRLIKEHMSFPGFRPLVLVDSLEGPMIFDFSLYPKFGLMIGIFPYISREDLLILSSNELSRRIILSDAIKGEAQRYVGHTASEGALAFAERVLSVKRSCENYTFILKTNSEVFSSMLDIVESFGSFYGCRFELSFDKICDDFEPKNNFCFESFAFSLISLLFLARNYSAHREAKLKICVDDMGFYYDLGFEMAEQYREQAIIGTAPVLKHLMSKAEDRMFTCFCIQKNGEFVLRAFPWLRTPDSADLKERRERFIYDY